MRAKGIDVSLWQDDNSTPQMVDFGQARRAGALFSFIKGAQGVWADPDFLMNWRNAQQAGMPRGAYHFLDWTASARDQARFFAGLLTQDPGELPPVLDFECRTNAPSRAAATKAALTFLEEVEAQLNRPAIVYTSPGYWREFGSPDPQFARRDLWIAHYYMDEPAIPAPWRDWLFWQWGTGKGLGPIYGAESLDIDQDWFNGTAADFHQRFGLAPVPTPDPVVVDGPLQVRVTVSGLNVRTGPGMAYPVIGMLRLGTEFVVEDVAGQHAWVMFHLPDGREAWACAQLATNRMLIPVRE